MVENADFVLLNYFASHTECAPEWERTRKLKNDPRITRVGKWLRRSSLDELPQLINILLGQMSLVGPRPIVQQEISRYGRSYELYRQVLPGLTGAVAGLRAVLTPRTKSRVAFDERIRFITGRSGSTSTYWLARFVVVISAEGAY